jgi:peptide chain release factor 1
MAAAAGRAARHFASRPPALERVTLEVRPGAGGTEAAAWAVDLLRMYARHASAVGWSWTPLAGVAGKRGVAGAVVSGAGARAALAGEAGVHAVKRVPANATRVHTSTATVVVLDGDAARAARAPPSLDAADVRLDTFRASGPGGQHANVTESAVRAVHVPTGASVVASRDRSQHRNKAAALAELARRVTGSQVQAAHALVAAERAAQAGTGARAERVRTYALHRGAVTDHATGTVLRPADRVLSGEWLGRLLGGGGGEGDN